MFTDPIFYLLVSLIIFNFIKMMIPLVVFYTRQRWQAHIAHAKVLDRIRKEKLPSGIRMEPLFRMAENLLEPGNKGADVHLFMGKRISMVLHMINQYFILPGSFVVCIAYVSIGIFFDYSEFFGPGLPVSFKIWSLISNWASLHLCENGMLSILVSRIGNKKSAEESVPLMKWAVIVIIASSALYIYIWLSMIFLLY